MIFQQFNWYRITMPTKDQHVCLYGSVMNISNTRGHIYCFFHSFWPSSVVPICVNGQNFKSTKPRLIESRKCVTTVGEKVIPPTHCFYTVTHFCVFSAPAALMQYLMEDLRGNIDLAVSWLYQEYSKSQGYMLQIQDMEENCYNDLLCSFLGSLQKRADQRDG